MQRQLTGNARQIALETLRWWFPFVPFCFPREIRQTNVQRLLNDG